MARRTITATIATVSLASASATLAQTGPAPPGPPISVFVSSLPDEEDGLLRAAIPQAPARFGLRPADVPPGVLPEGKFIEIEARVTVDADGAVTACHETTSPLAALKGVVCRAVMARGTFLPALDRAGRRVTDVVPIMAKFVSAIVRPAPPALETIAGRADDPLVRGQEQTLAVAADPDWKPFHPGKAGEAVVRMTAYDIRPDGGASIYCTPLRPQEDQPSWEAACKAMEAAKYRTNPALRSNVLTALVTWQAGGGAKLAIAPPGRPGTPIVWASLAAQHVPGIALDKTIAAQAQIDFPVGRTTPRCRITLTTGDDATDLAACRHLETLHFTSPIDVFGRAFAVKQNVRIVAAAAVAPPG